MENRKTKTLIYNENLLALSGIRELFRSCFSNMEVEGYNDIETISILDLTEFRLLFLCVSESRQDEFAKLIKRIAVRQPEAKIVVYSDQVDYRTAVHYLASGATGYLTQLDNLYTLFTCIERVQRGELYVCQRVTESLIQSYGEPKFAAPKVLTNREKEVARLLADGLRVTEIADQMTLKMSTVSTMKKNVLKKLGVRSVVELPGRSMELQ